MRIAGLTRVLVGTMLLAASLPARADFSFDAKLGWDARVRNGRWNPVQVRLQNTATVSVDLELYTPRDSSQAVMTRFRAVAGPVARTYVMYAPLAVGPDAITLKVVDADSRKTLGETKLVDPDRINAYGNGEYGDDLVVYRTGLFVGVSGAEPVLKELGARDAVGDARETVGYLRPAVLPEAAMGYDAVDVLVLNRPDVNALDPAQKKAILDWVRAGGTLLAWFDAGPLPPDDPFVLALPCKVGDNTTIELEQSDLVRAGLPERFTKMGGRVLVPAADANVINVLGGGGAKLVYHRYGLGAIAVLSFDGSALLFRNNDDARAFWEPLLQPGSRNPGEKLPLSTSSRYLDERDRAATELMDLLGNVPGVGTFGFGYVATTLIALMLIVGPIDWFVLKWLGRQPWTWVTTTGWIGLITVAGIYMGHLFRSGDLHLRTLRIVDQADGAVVARTDFVGIYSPRTADYELEPAPHSWWEPMSAERYYYTSDRVINVLNCRQGTRENVPDPKNPMTIPVWNLRFLRGRTIEKGEPPIEASLQIREAAGGSAIPRVVGTIANLGDAPITQLRIQARGGDIYLGHNPASDVVAFDRPLRIAPHGILSIDVPVRYDANRPPVWDAPGTDKPDTDKPGTDNQSGPEVTTTALSPSILRLAEQLTPEWARRTKDFVPEGYSDRRPGEDDMACVSALIDGGPAAATLKGWEPVEKNWVVVRALVKLRKPADK